MFNRRLACIMLRLIGLWSFKITCNMLRLIGLSILGQFVSVFQCGGLWIANKKQNCYRGVLCLFKLYLWNYDCNLLITWLVFHLYVQKHSLTDQYGNITSSFTSLTSFDTRMQRSCISAVEAIPGQWLISIYRANVCSCGHINVAVYWIVHVNLY
jgi:hypothetical protein